MTGKPAGDDPCEDMHLLLQAELDGELDAAAAVALRTHIRGCAGCTALRDDLVALGGRIRSELTRHAAPASLRHAVRASLPRATRAPPWGHAASFAAGLAVAASVATIMVLRPPDGPAPEIPELVAAHIRGLQPGHLLDVVSTDQHTVKPWFDGRLDFAPPVRDFAAAGFPLIGGRLDYVAGRAVAVLIYQRGRHLIDLFVWPGSAPGASVEAHGYNVRAWEQDGMVMQAVSDLNATELAAFGRLWRDGG